MARQKLNPSKKDNIYWYKDDNVKKYAFRYRYYDSAGVRKEKSKQGFTTEKAAEIALTELKAEILTGNYTRVDNENITISQWLEAWREANYSKWKISTLHLYTYCIDKHLIPSLGHIKLRALTKTKYQDFINKLLEKYSLSTVKTVHAVLNYAINEAVNDELLLRNKISAVVFPRKAVKSFDEDEKHLSNEEIKYLLDYVKKQEGFTHFVLILLLVTTGIRKGEAAGLKWEDIDFTNNILTIQRTRDYLGTRPTKSHNSMRKIDVGNYLISYLEKYKVWSMEKLLSDGRKLINNDFVFINEYSLEPISRSFPNNILERAFEADVIKRITPHTLRHTCASILISKGIPVTTVAKMLGDSVETILRVYAHSLREKEKEIVKIMDSVMNFD